MTSASFATAGAIGGSGGAGGSSPGGLAGAQGHGGDASATATAIGPDSAPVEADADAVGGGIFSPTNAVPGRATARASAANSLGEADALAQGAPSTAVETRVDSIAAYALSTISNPAVVGGPAQSASAVDTVRASHGREVSLGQAAIGGDSTYGAGIEGPSGGGNAQSVLDASNALPGELDVVSTAQGGASAGSAAASVSGSSQHGLFLEASAIGGATGTVTCDGPQGCRIVRGIGGAANAHAVGSGNGSLNVNAVASGINSALHADSALQPDGKEVSGRVSIETVGAPYLGQALLAPSRGTAAGAAVTTTVTAAAVSTLSSCIGFCSPVLTLRNGGVAIGLDPDQTAFRNQITPMFPHALAALDAGAHALATGSLALGGDPSVALEYRSEIDLTVAPISSPKQLAIAFLGSTPIADTILAMNLSLARDGQTFFEESLGTSPFANAAFDDTSVAVPDLFMPGSSSEIELRVDYTSVPNTVGFNFAFAVLATPEPGSPALLLAALGLLGAFSRRRASR